MFYEKGNRNKLFFQAVGYCRHMGKPESSSCHYDISKQTKYLLSMLRVSDNGQARPATYEIQKEKNRHFIVEGFKRLYIGYDEVKDILSISYYGSYLRD